MKTGLYRYMLFLTILLIIAFCLIIVLSNSNAKGSVAVMCLIIVVPFLSLATYDRFRDAGKGIFFSIVVALFSWTVYVPIWGMKIPSKE
ncbi:hypothetical protein K8R66_03265 [bacterium]|nr:hypothetical protein [bacterium]